MIESDEMKERTGLIPEFNSSIIDQIPGMGNSDNPPDSRICLTILINRSMGLLGDFQRPKPQD
jgi:hypothetical protein